MKRNKLIMALALTVLITFTAGAQRSTLNAATFGLFSGDADKFMDVNDWNEVKFNKFYAFLDGGSSNFVSGGFATRLGQTYLGIYYTGNLFRYDSTKSKDANGGLSGSVNPTSSPAYNNYANTSTLAFNDNLSILAGLPFGGLKLNISTNLSFRNSEDANTYKVKDRVGPLAFNLSWGNNFALGSGTLKPEVRAGYSINMKKLKVEPKAGTNTYTDTSGANILSLGLGADYVFEAKNNSQAVLSVQDTFRVNFYKNPQMESGTTKIYQDKNPISNDLSVSYKKTYNLDDRFSAGWLLGGDFFVSVDPVKTRIETGAVSTTTADYSGTTISLSPYTGIGFTYALVPERFSLNGGARVYLLNMYYDTFKDSLAVNTGQTKTQTQFSIVGLSDYNVALGGTLILNPMFTFDFSFGGSSGYSYLAALFSIKK
ncbi:hypothetical protein AGMMS50230_02420 [Spirochaetia bacterium]|nr:hypothetical protein AGMMS50230_02420 [Spirochaetia bacterium]